MTDNEDSEPTAEVPPAKSGPTIGKARPMAATPDVIKRQIGPGLRSMYVTVLDEALPDDLLMIVEQLADQEDPKEADSEVNAGKHGETDG